jgi:predicted AAA+ superfamily ATPase
MPAALHEAALARYREYLVVGGLPEVLGHYAETRNHVLVRHTQEMILQGYLNDMSKYNQPNNIGKTRLVYNTVTAQLSKENTRFQYKYLKHGARSAEYESAIEWLTLSGIVTRLCRVSQARKPLSSYQDLDAFKIYLSDPGLLCAKKDIPAEDILYGSRGLDDFKGGLAENYVCSQLTANGHVGYYWTSEGRAEVDFVIQREGIVVPIEVKSGGNTRSKSLSVFMNIYGPSLAYKLTTGNFGRVDKVKTIPLYAAFCL